MKEEMAQRINGVGILFRFVTPIMVGILLAITSGFLSEMRWLRNALDNHLQTDVADIRERLARIEAQLEKE